MSNEEFLSLFQSLDTNIPEKRRRFNSFIKELDLRASNSEDLSKLILSVTPKNITEELIKIEFVIHFRLDNILINELKHNNSILIKKLLKNRKIFGDLFSNIHPQFFVNDILPYLSHSTKLKLLHGISKSVSNENLVDQYFMEVEEVYGLKLAMTLLQGCTVNLIKDRLERCTTKLSCGQLMHIVKKDKEFLMCYLDFLMKRDPNDNFYYYHRKIFKNFAKMHPDMYWKVNDKHKMHLRFGKRITTTMFRHRNKELKEGYEFLNYFVSLHHLYKVARKDGQLREFLFNLFPSTLDDYINSFSWYNILKFIECFPYIEQFALVSSIFKEKYDENLLDNPEYCKKCLQIIPTQQREPIVDILVKDDEELIYFYSPEKSIPILKGKLQHCADSQERGRLTSLLCKTCRVNNDKDALLQVLDYILKRHKNDIIVLTVFFNNFMHYPGAIKLDVACWQKITDIVKIFELSRPDYDIDIFYINYIKHLIQKGISLEECCKKRLQDIFNAYSYVAARAFSLQLPNKYRKMYLEEMGKYIHLYKDHKNYQVACVSFLHGIICLNRNNKKYTLELKNYSHLFDQIRVTTECHISNAIILHNLKLYPSDEIWRDLFWKISKYARNNSFLAWYVQKWPEKVASNTDKVFDEMELRSIQIFLKEAKRCLDENTLEKFKMCALNNMHNEDYDKVKLAVAILCYITPKTLLDIIIPFITNTDSGVKAKLSKCEFLLVKLITKRLHKLGNSSDILPLVATCSTQNYAKYAIPPLNSIACNSPEIYMRSELSRFTDKKLCVKKNVLFLSKLLFPSNVFAEVIRVFSEKETDMSIKKAIFQKTFECLNENPSDFFWSFLKKCILSMDKTNVSMYNLLMDITKIPQQYLSEYIPLVFEEISNNPCLEIRKNRLKFLENIPVHIIGNLSIEFLKGVIQETACLEDVSNFHWKCAFCVKAVQQEELLKENIRILKNFIECNHLSLNKNRNVRIAINCFISRFLEVALEFKENYNLIKIFCTLWNLEINLNDCNGYMVVLLTELYFRNDFDAFKTGIDTRQLLQEYVERAGPSIINLFSVQLYKFLIKIDFEKQEILSKFVEGLFANSTDENICTLIIYIFSKYPPKPQNRDNYVTIFQTLLKSDNSIIKFHLNQFGYIC